MSNEKQNPRRPYEVPTVKKQENLKNVTLFTNFGP